MSAHDLRSADSTSSTMHPRFTAGLQRVVQSVRCPGAYSVGKMDACHAYMRAASKGDALLVLVCTPLLALAIVLALASIPLHDPYDFAAGLRVQSGFLVATFLTNVALAFAVTVEMQELVPEMGLTWRAFLLVGAVDGALVVATLLAVACTTGVFPVPFFHMVAIVPMVVGGSGSTFLLAAPRRAQVPDLFARIHRALALVRLETAPLLAYAGFAAGFNALSASQQMGFCVLLPVLKHLFRCLLWRESRTRGDIAGILTSGSSHLFHALFTASCLPNAKSVAVLGVLIAWNCSNALLYYHDIREDRKLLQSVPRSEKDDQAGKREDEDVVTAALRLLEEELQNPTKATARLQRQASYHRYHSDKWAAWPTRVGIATLFVRRVTRDEDVRAASPAPATAATASRPKRWWARQSPSVHALSLDATLQASAPVLPGRKSDSQIPSESTQRVQFIQDVAAALHRNEMLLLRAYISIFVPVFYVIYIVVVHAQPNARYYSSMTALQTRAEVGRAALPLLLLAALELAFFASHATAMRQSLRVSALKQLAFVLRSQAMLVQAKLVALTLMTLTFPLLHMGNDLTFQFQWIQKVQELSS